jgi:hypothetical protein
VYIHTSEMQSEDAICVQLKTNPWTLARPCQVALAHGTLPVA